MVPELRIRSRGRAAVTETAFAPPAAAVGAPTRLRHSGLLLILVRHCFDAIARETFRMRPEAVDDRLATAVVRQVLTKREEFVPARFADPQALRPWGPPGKGSGGR